MPCEIINTPTGTIIACSRGSRRCYKCGRPAKVLCDHPDPSRSSGTCDRPCCGAHAVYAGGKRDYCVDHAER